MKFPESITIEPAEIAALNKLEEQRQGVEAFSQQIFAAGERRNAELMAAGRDLWTGLAKKYDLDIEHVSYANKDGKLVPVAVKL